MKALLSRITDVQPHPKNHELRTLCDVVTIAGKVNVSTRLADGSPRYAVGDYAIVLVDNLLLPEWALRMLDLWNEEEGKGRLSGKLGNRTKGRKIAEVLSEVALCKVRTWISPPNQIHGAPDYYRRMIRIWVDDHDLCPAVLYVKIIKGTEEPVLDGIDMTAFLDITPYESNG